MQDKPTTRLDIEALADRQLPREDRLRVYRALRRNPHLQQHYRNIMAQRRLLRLWWQGTQLH